MKKVAIIQSNYIPWKGYFDLCSAADEVVFFDEVQFTRRDWRNRNKIKTPNGVQWLTVPVKSKGKFFQKIADTEIDNENWSKLHWQTILYNYKRSKFFNEISCILEPIYNKKYITISELNMKLIEEIFSYLEIDTEIKASKDFFLPTGKTEKLLSICMQLNGTEYISGPSAKNYIKEELFETKGIKINWFNYDGYPTYPQLWGKFIHEVSIIDLMFNCGRDSLSYMRRNK